VLKKEVLELNGIRKKGEIEHAGDSTLGTIHYGPQERKCERAHIPIVLRGEGGRALWEKSVLYESGSKRFGRGAREGPWLVYSRGL